MAGIDGNALVVLNMNGALNSTNFVNEGTLGLLVTANGNAHLDTGLKVFGSAAGTFDEVGDYLSFGTHPGLAFGTGDFTIEAFIGLVVSGNVQCLCGMGDAAAEVNFYFYSNNWYWGLESNTLSGNWAWTPAAGATYHVAFVRSGGNVKAYINGSSLGAAQNGNLNIPLTYAHAIGRGSGSNYWKGMLDSLRISNIARYTTDFTPPAAEWSAEVVAAGLSQVVFI